MITPLMSAINVFPITNTSALINHAVRLSALIHIEIINKDASDVFQNCMTVDVSSVCTACDNGYYHKNKCINNCPVETYGVKTFDIY